MAIHAFRKQRERDDWEGGDVGGQWKVRREKEVMLVEGCELQLGDIVFLKETDVVPGDGFLLKVEVPFGAFDDERDRHVVVSEKRGE